ncbi:MAG: PASTA domain-containing protein [Bacillati bacterium ANGP1]|uniref:non-specific serine/threonine protein kinase n=1 Tax=Candidatus Segetimicrobium genomatis TaxID=2569760 RepID=A0A537M7R0_9BACT|nr:MAG: PASTA domain-containing protein [Terrabacteria group bacterium ANGP1]
MIGRILGGNYEVMGPLGEGGMATVYRGRRISDGRAVAIKVLREQYAHDRGFVARFEREAQAVARLSHPHMVQVLDSGRDGDVHFIVMEYVEGEDLKTLLRREHILPEKRAREIGAQVCEVLAYAHTQGIVHRDIKPQNILLTVDGQVKVTDFGIARALASAAITETGTVLGSVQYLSPEQARGLGVGQSADLYSLGVVLFEAVAGQLPFDGDSPIAIALKHIHEPPPTPGHNDAPVSRETERIILKALAKDPRDRYRSAEEMREDLIGAATHWGELSRVEDTKVVRRSDRAAGGRRWAVTPEQAGPLLVAVAGAVIVIVVALLGWQALVGYLNVPEVTVPDFVGKSLADAQSRARQDHLNVQVIQQSYSRTVPTGFVLGQDEAAGKVVKMNRVIGLTTSLGPEMVSVPDVRRRSLLDARFMIEEARLTVGEVREAYDASVPPGVVLSQDPAPGALLQRGTAVYLRVNRGPERVILPDLVGQPLDEARRMLNDIGVTLRQVTQVPRSGIPPGQVVEMAPRAGTQIRHGDAVTVMIAATPGAGGAPPPQPIVTGTLTPVTPGDPGRKHARITVVVGEGAPRQVVKIVVVDAQGTRVAYEKAHAPGATVSTQVDGSGYTIVQVYIDNRLIQEIRP